MPSPPLSLSVKQCCLQQFTDRWTKGFFYTLGKREETWRPRPLHLSTLSNTCQMLGCSIQPEETVVVTKYKRRRNERNRKWNANNVNWNSFFGCSWVRYMWSRLGSLISHWIVFLLCLRPLRCQVVWWFYPHCPPVSIVHLNSQVWFRGAHPPNRHTVRPTWESIGKGFV